LPYIEQDALYKSFGSPLNLQTAGTNLGHRATVKTYACPSDPTYGNGLPQGDWASGCYAANFQVFGKPEAGNDWGQNGYSARSILGITDGTSNTILFAEKYTKCKKLDGSDRYTLWAHGNWNNTWSPLFAYSDVNGNGFNSALGDSVDGRGGAASKFQIQPVPADCGLASSAHSGVMQVGMGDGSVRGLSNSVDPTRVWWWILTPAGGEVPDPF